MHAFGVFEGGGARGYAHVGALAAAEERGIFFDAVAGTSSGAIVAALVAAGYGAAEIYQQTDLGEEGVLALDAESLIDPADREPIRNIQRRLARLARSAGKPQEQSYSCVVTQVASQVSRWFRRRFISYWLYGAWAYIWHRLVVRRVFREFGITSTDRLRDWLDAALRDKLNVPPPEPIQFLHLPKQLRIVAANITTGTIRVFGDASDQELSVVDAVIASASYPIFFRPAHFKGDLYVDGGLLSNLPAWVFDDERAKLARPKPTFAFRFVGAPQRSSNAPARALANLAHFVTRLARTSVSGARLLESRQIEGLHVVELVADIETLSFDDVASKRNLLVAEGRRGVEAYFDKNLGPRDYGVMNVALRVIANQIKDDLDIASLIRAAILLPIDEGRFRVTYSAHMDDDGDDQLVVYRSSPGVATSFRTKQPVLVDVTRLPENVTLAPLYKPEHKLRRAEVKTVFASPIFEDATEWSKPFPEERSDPMALFVWDSDEDEDVRRKLYDERFLDRLAAYAQIAGEVLQETLLMPKMEEEAVGVDEIATHWAAADGGPPGILFDQRKERRLVEDHELSNLMKRIEQRIGEFRKKAISSDVESHGEG